VIRLDRGNVPILDCCTTARALTESVALCRECKFEPLKKGSLRYEIVSWESGRKKKYVGINVFLEGCLLRRVFCRYRIYGFDRLYQHEGFGCLEGSFRFAVGIA
jgi:hypothetical protein